MNNILIDERLDRKREVVDLGKSRTKPIRVSRKKSSYITIKYAVEYLMALSLFLLLVPFLALVAVFIKLDSSGSVLFRQKRYGLSGKPFMMYKFRTMIDGAHLMQDKISHLNEMDGGKLFKTDNDPRITRIGSFLRKYSIDELPQLFNILKGDMTVIGPRPLSTPLEEYEKDELERFKVKPGLGCIWQAYFRKETTFKEWMKTDVVYVRSISAKLDSKLFFVIAKNVLLGKGAR